MKKKVISFALATAILATPMFPTLSHADKPGNPIDQELLKAVEEGDIMKSEITNLNSTSAINYDVTLIGDIMTLYQHGTIYGPYSFNITKSSSLVGYNYNKTGPTVLTAQVLLIIYHAQTGQGNWLDSDGLFGPATYNMVKLFQKNHGLSVDGIIGPATWRMLARYK